MVCYPHPLFSNRAPFIYYIYMISLVQYLRECGENCATPGNTLGAGNPVAPEGAVVGSGDVPTAKALKEKRKKKKTQ